MFGNRHLSESLSYPLFLKATKIQQSSNIDVKHWYHHAAYDTSYTLRGALRASIFRHTIFPHARKDFISVKVLFDKEKISEIPSLLKMLAIKTNGKSHMHTQ